MMCPLRTLRTAVPVVLLLGAVALHGAPVAAQEAGSAAGEALTEADSVTRELRRLYESDQADRRWDRPPTPEQWKEIAKRDAERRDRVMELVRSGALATAEDYFHAAMVLQHGSGSEDILIAHILATVAGFEGHAGGRWLSAAALDRYLHRTDEPQRLGTQYVREPPDGSWSLGAYERWLPDAIRDEYGVRPLSEQEAYVDTLNAR